jgi:creatinine amidohydrolase
MALHCAPESVSPDYRSLPPCPDVRPQQSFMLAARAARAVGAETLARELTFAAIGLGWNALRPFPGYTGRPHRATPQAGAIFARAILDGYEPLVEDVMAGRAQSPPPIMSWAGTLSLGGRLGGMGSTDGGGGG